MNVLSDLCRVSATEVACALALTLLCQAAAQPGGVYSCGE